MKNAASCIKQNPAHKADTDVLFIETLCIAHINLHIPKHTCSSQTAQFTCFFFQGGAELSRAINAGHVTTFTIRFMASSAASVPERSSLMIQCSPPVVKHHTLCGHSLYDQGPSLHLPPTNTFALTILLISHLANSTEYYLFIIFNVHPAHSCSVYSFSPVC